MPQLHTQQFKNAAWLIMLLAILTFGAFTRLHNIHLVHNVDEPNIILRAVKVADGQLHIRWYNWPAQSLIRLNGSVFTGIHQVYSVTHPSRQYSTQELYQFHKIFFITTAHVSTSIFALLTLIVMFGIGYVLWKEYGGLLGAGLLSIDYLHVLHSRFATPDVPLLFFLLSNIFIALCVIKYQPSPKERRWLWMLAGGILGAAVATKYTGALAGVPIVLTLIWGKWQLGQQRQISWEAFRRSWLSIGGFLITAFCIHLLLNPFFLVDLPLIIHKILFEAGGHRLGVDWSGKKTFFRNFYFYLHGSLSWNGTLISFIGWTTMLISGLKFRRQIWHPVLVMAITYLIFLLALSSLGLHWSRWSLPLTPLILACATFGLAKVSTFIFSQHKKLLNVLVVILFIFILLPQISISLLVGSASKSISTASVMSAYIVQHVPLTSPVVADMYYLADKNPLHLAYPNTKLYKKSFASLKDSGVEYVVVKKSRYGYAKKQPKLYSNIIHFIEDLRTHSDKVTTIRKQQDTLLNHKKDFEFYQHLPLLFSLFGSPTPTHGPTLELYKIRAD